MKKTYVLDTNVLLSDPTSITSFEDNDVIIPMIVLEELDDHKSRQDEVGRNARQVSRALDDLRLVGHLSEGVTLPCSGTLKVVPMSHNYAIQVPTELKMSKVDNTLIMFMLQLKAAGEDAILVSKDINVRIKCDSLGIKCQDYLKLRVTDDPAKFYKGVAVIEVPEEVVDVFYRDGNLSLDADPALANKELFSNQIVVIKSVFAEKTTRSAMTRYPGDRKPLVPLVKVETVFGLKPRNKEQTFALDLLLDDQVKLVTLTGPAGTGKTSITLAAALEQLIGLGREATARYEKLIVTRPVLPLGKDIGFLPGTLEEKMKPWIAPINDNINFLVNNSGKRQHNFKQAGGKFSDDYYLTMLQERGLIEVEAITFIRGRSIPNAFIIIDEAQNLSVHELKTILTRTGENSKIVLLGDIEQIDNVHVDMYTNGLTYAVEKFKYYDIAAHISLIKGERSSLATLASQIL